ncbi:MAG: rod shape-determining protein RodA [Rickettsiales bacterium]|jgi:rod shape determining protein RodA|nr:rod shape-determining protein RodA [Rickettsiales bacterium]
MGLAVRITRAESLSIMDKIPRINKPLLGCMFLLLFISIATLYSIGGRPCNALIECTFGGWNPYAWQQLLKIGLGLIVFAIAALINIKFVIRSSYIMFTIALVMVLMVSLWGHTGMGAARWLDLWLFKVQPSEFIKISMVVCIARYFSWLNSAEVKDWKQYLIPIILFAAPFVLVLKQPDLGTAISLFLIISTMFFMIGAPRKWFIVIISLVLLSSPVVWKFAMHDYQRDRILTLIDPAKDPKGKGYQIIQSKMTIGSGGFAGKGYLSGAQAALNFLPEKQTDFIFAVWGEQFGFLGAIFLLAIYTIISVLLYRTARSSKNRFGQLLSIGFMVSLFVYYFVNMAMVMGLMPVVGTPLPLLSFGGSSLISLMLGFGLVQNAHIHKDIQLSGKGN